MSQEERLHEHPTILVVDDNPDNLQLAASVLTQAMECDLSFATSGPEALEVLGCLLPDLILLDVSMPDLDGYEVCRRIKSSPAMRSIPVIFLTARTSTADIVLGFQCGGADYVTKPFRAEELVARVKVHVSLRRAEAEIQSLKGLLPTCANCKKVRDEGGHWQPIEVYIAQRSEARFSHSLCPDCVPLYFPGES